MCRSINEPRNTQKDMRGIRYVGLLLDEYVIERETSVFLLSKISKYYSIRSFFLPPTGSIYIYAFI